MDLSSSRESSRPGTLGSVPRAVATGPTPLPHALGYFSAMVAVLVICCILCCGWQSIDKLEGGMLFVKSIAQAFVVLMDSIAGGVLNKERNKLRLDGWMNVDVVLEGTLEIQNITVFFITLFVYTLDIACTTISVMFGSETDMSKSDRWFLESGAEILLIVSIFIQAIIVIVFDSICLSKIVSFTKCKGKFWEEVSSSRGNDIYGNGVVNSLSKKHGNPNNSNVKHRCNIMRKFGSLGRTANMLMKEQTYTIRTLQVKHKALSEELMKKVSEKGLDKEIAEQYNHLDQNNKFNTKASSSVSASAAAQEARLTSQISNTKHKILVMNDEIAALRKEILELNKSNESLALKVETEKMARDVQ